jgi:hypothetical protein
MAKMPAQNFSFSRNLTGATVPPVLTFDIATGTVIEQGEVVSLTESLVVAVSGDTTAVLGVSKDPHDGTTDGQTGTRLQVYCGPGCVFKCTPATTFTAASGTTTNTIKVVALGALANDDLNGGYVKCLTATTAANVGKVVRITDFVKTDGVITAAGSWAVADTFLVFPPVGSQKFALDADGTNIDLIDGAGTILTIVSTDPYKTEQVEVTLGEHIFANVKA